MQKIWTLLVLAIAGLYSMPLLAQEALPKADFSALRPDTTTIKVQKVIDPLTFIATNGTIYKLSELDVPGLDTGGSDAVEQATKKVTELLADQDIKAYITKDQTRGRQNRMGQALIQAERKKDGLWIQGQLVADGLARVRTTSSNAEMSKQLYALEQSARAQKKGLWANPDYGVYGIDLISPKANSFVLVEGRVFSISNRNNETFLNFGADWRKDFTIGISPDMRREIAKKGINFSALAHKQVRVRGFIEDRNGPFITLDHPEQLEVLDGTLPIIEKPQLSGGMKSFKTPDKPKAPAIKEPDAPTLAKEENQDKNTQTPVSEILPEVLKTFKGNQ